MAPLPRLASACAAAAAAAAACNCGSMSACMGCCPASPPSAYQTCARECAAQCGAAPTPSPGTRSTFSVVTATAANVVPSGFLGLGEEMNGFLDGCAEGKWSDPTFRRLASHLRPFTLRVGGITGDWVRYTGFSNGELGGYWPTDERNFTTGHWQQLADFARETGAMVIFMLNELHGRDCHSQGTEKCVGTWDTSNLKAFLNAVSKEDNSDWFTGFELGNELTNPYDPHLTVDETIRDMQLLHNLTQGVFGAAPPPLFAPSTDHCNDGQPAQYLQGVAASPGRSLTGGFTFHSYPGQGGEKFPAQLRDIQWLRDGVVQNDAHAHAGSCVAAATQMDVPMYLTESNSVYAWQQPTTSQFINGFWYVASLGQYALFPNMRMHARWCLSENTMSTFSTIRRDPGTGATTVVPDYWTAVLHKRLMGETVLSAGIAAEDAGLLYAACTRGAGDGSVTVMYANPGNGSLTLTPQGGAAWEAHELYILTEGGDAAASMLNGKQLQPTASGDLPAMGAAPGTGDIVVPPASYGFAVFPNAGAAACRAAPPR